MVRNLQHYESIGLAKRIVSPIVDLYETSDKMYLAWRRGCHVFERRIVNSLGINNGDVGCRSCIRCVLVEKPLERGTNSPWLYVIDASVVQMRCYTVSAWKPIYESRLPPVSCRL